MNRSRLALASSLLFAAATATACDLVSPEAPSESDVLDGPIDGMSGAQVALHLEGDEAFSERFAVSDGLGPIFVATSCEQCHVGDGKGHPVFNLTRFGRLGSDGTFDPMSSVGGPQLQHRAIPGYEPEHVPNGATGRTALMAPAVSGLGFLDAVDDATLAALADPQDFDGDGVSGRLQLLAPSPVREAIVHSEGRSAPEPGARGSLVNGAFIGRFGKKGAAVNLLEQTVGAYQQDMGITSDFLPDDPFNASIGNAAGDAVADPEVTGSTVDAVVFYLKTLRAPSRRGADLPEVLEGERVFGSLGCGSCHQPTLRTGRSEIAVLDQVTFHPFTDLLLHDMGPELDDGYTEGRASTSEWRTPPLWGVGIQENFQGGRAFYLHDGRAASLEAAIELHGGEGGRSRDRYRALSDQERRALLTFLRSL